MMIYDIQNRGASYDLKILVFYEATMCNNLLEQIICHDENRMRKNEYFMLNSLNVKHLLKLLNIENQKGKKRKIVCNMMP